MNEHDVVDVEEVCDGPVDVVSLLDQPTVCVGHSLAATDGRRICPATREMGWDNVVSLLVRFLAWLGMEDHWAGLGVRPRQGKGDQATITSSSPACESSRQQRSGHPPTS
ncbi:MAG: hypothetical protein M3381_04310 [Actinomycetota bacterium]|nr:hypothetical protein [Actinomycetota bacterium]MDQ3715248.1 hypothetical protein [Actinomycetota bacterium]